MNFVKFPLFAANFKHIPQNSEEKNLKEDLNTLADSSEIEIPGETIKNAYMAVYDAL